MKCFSHLVLKNNKSNYKWLPIVGEELLFTLNKPPVVPVPGIIASLVEKS